MPIVEAAELPGALLKRKFEKRCSSALASPRALDERDEAFGQQEGRREALRGNEETGKGRKREKNGRRRESEGGKLRRYTASSAFKFASARARHDAARLGARVLIHPSRDVNHHPPRPRAPIMDFVARS